MLICEFHNECGNSKNKTKCHHGTPHEHDSTCDSSGCFSSTFDDKKDYEGKIHARCVDAFISLVKQAIKEK